MTRGSNASGIASSIVTDGSAVVAVGLDDDASGDTAVRGYLETKGGKRHQVRFVPVRGSLGSAGVARIRSQHPPGKAPVIVLVERVGPEVRGALLTHGLGYIDAAGNCHLELAGGRIVVQISGKRAVAASSASATLHAAGYRVLFALLVRPALLDSSVRAVETVANASRHSVTVLLARLRAEGLVVRAGRSRHLFVPGGREACIDRFASGWADVLRGRLLAGRYRLREREPEAMERAVVSAFEAQRVPFGFGGPAGAARMTRYLQWPETTIHTIGWNAATQARLGAIPDREGPVTVYRTMGKLDLDSPVPFTAHPLLIHAELASSSEPRLRETATVVLEQMLGDR